jgi:small conductance mechanosensitive channel
MNINQAVEPVVEKLQSWSDTLLGLLPNLVVAILLLILAWIAGRLARRLATRVARRADARSAIVRLLGTLTFLGVLGLGVFIALGVLELDKTVTSLLAGAGVVGLALGFAAQSLAANVISGTVISLRRPFREGDLVESGAHFGTVSRIDLRVTHIERADGQVVLIPNRDVLENPLINFSTHPPRRVEVEVGVTYDADLDEVRAVTIDAVEAVQGRLEERDVEVYFREFGGSSINVLTRFWVPDDRQSGVLAAQSDAIRRIHRAYAAHGITIPFPIRTLDFGIEGGRTLTEAMRPLTAGERRTVG